MVSVAQVDFPHKQNQELGENPQHVKCQQHSDVIGVVVGKGSYPNLITLKKLLVHKINDLLSKIFNRITKKFNIENAEEENLIIIL